MSNNALMVNEDSVSAMVGNLRSHVGLSIGRYTVGGILDKLIAVNARAEEMERAVYDGRLQVGTLKAEITELNSRLKEKCRPILDSAVGAEGEEIQAMKEELDKLRKESKDFKDGVVKALEDIRYKNGRIDKLLESKHGPENIMLTFRNRTFDSLDVLASYQGGNTISIPAGKATVYVAWDGDPSRQEFDDALIALAMEGDDEEVVSDTEIIVEPNVVPETEPEAVGNLP